MVVLRLWFVALLAVAVFRNQPVEDYVDDTWEPHVEAYEYISEPREIPEYEFYSFLNQETGTWDK